MASKAEFLGYVSPHPFDQVDDHDIRGIQARVVVRWLAEVLSEYVLEMPDDRELELMKICVLLGVEKVDVVRFVDDHTGEAHLVCVKESISVLADILVGRHC